MEPLSASENKSKTIEELIQSAIQYLNNSGSARLDTEVLLTHVLKANRAYLFAHPEKVVPDNVRKEFLQLIEQRKDGRPVAHLTGHREFWSLQLNVTPDTLIPRPETELLVEKILELIPKNTAWQILDLGTGSGAIALAIAHERAGCSVTATDISGEALNVAKSNAQQLNIHNIQFLSGHWLEPLADKRFNVIVSNPPYISKLDPHLRQGDVRFEPESALVAENNGLACIEQITANAGRHLYPGGILAFEHGYKQGTAVREILQKQGFADIQTSIDLSGHERITLGKLPD
ncbi:MAG: peptide chain release factor N(5)-glutamine methyltransferase [Gammaproteobacteria bacterium]|nr:peptide chain release factor N(5)-glutamine methyltransferase [Gammaproteobacteria bacterium]MDH5593441.1 peptide chain release factor N(5)-glutamine methyltransferase [Gammaproteobacteria bacterium]MDH5614161.1 peptide chain release factor N(5)-glutamine methyltransferase [Gammaproteobacteria bacterium]